ncbi:MAG: sugar ABC transporter ATP-binding protein [Caldiserica bacterium]|nr:sugar ABC transporter ATP-binding protein [Caldisericota bacterium]
MTHEAHARPWVEMRGIHKWFGGVHALKGVDFSVRRGEVVGLIGDNGAGKSTLIKILSGVFPPDKGEILIEGHRVRFRSPKDAKQHGIETVYQELALVDNLDVPGNIFLGREPALVGGGSLLALLHKGRMVREARDLLARLKVDIGDLNALAGELSGGQRQTVAIARALYTEPKLLIMDEPTAALAVQEAKKVLDLVRNLRERNIGVVFISHTLQEVFAVADRIVILRKGEKVGDFPVDELTIDEAVKLMVGGE